jgi:hypothetical protein
LPGGRWQIVIRERHERGTRQHACEDEPRAAAQVGPLGRFDALNELRDQVRPRLRTSCTHV